MGSIENGFLIYIFRVQNKHLWHQYDILLFQLPIALMKNTYYFIKYTDEIQTLML